MISVGDKKKAQCTEVIVCRFYQKFVVLSLQTGDRKTEQTLFLKLKKSLQFLLK